MDRAYEGDETRQLALALGYEPAVVPIIANAESNPGSTTSRERTRRNERAIVSSIEGIPPHLLAFREARRGNILGFIVFALIIDALR